MYYFAYGSNMNWQQMTQRCPSARFVSVARLPEHKLAITRQSRRRLCGNGDKPIEVLLYIAEKEPNPPLPNAEYKRLMVEGARHWKLPQTYLEMLEKIIAEEEKKP